MLIDDVTIKVSAGHGGKGAVAFNKQAMSLGPTGGSGGTGGSVYFEGVSDLSALEQFRYEKDVKAKDGENGKGSFNDGADGDDLVIRVPLGVVVHKFGDSSALDSHIRKKRSKSSLLSVVKTHEAIEVLKIGEKILIAKGGHGGKGNFLFRSSRNTTPREFQEGLYGEQFTVRLELKLIADVGLIGFPNVGKSSLLNELTKAKSKVANYKFTTLEPHLGVYYGLILADIPGLIEGASSGKGLGTKFLRHIVRTKFLFHLISAQSENPTTDYKTIRKELAMYGAELTKKTEHIFLTKSDTVSAGDLKKKISVFKKLHKKITPISIYDWDSLLKVKKILKKIQADK